ncbi:hypothetical protein MPH_05245 [Lasallia pustulata]|uniref:Uncharacterized protein n=1 Tax=Lasallia pustulata TaxID=136370 RepID=A0A1W5CRZ6_9LECA|nr:hypothetical protein MPH_05245 [Lasallia pustulata]
MLASRTAVRATRVLRARSILRNARFESTSSSSTGGSSFFPALIGGAAGGAVTFLGGYTWYHFSGVKTFVNAMHETKSYFDQAKQQMKDAAPEPNEALNWLRQTATSYAAFIPGAKGYIDTAFDDLDAIRNKHGDEVDKIVRDAYTELKTVTQENGMSMETAQKVWDIMQKHLKKIGELAGDAAQDILNNHPELKEKVGGNLDQLKQMGDKYGPEAKKQVDKTWEQISDIIKGGVSMETAAKIRKVVQEKMEMVQKMGDEAWKKGMEQAKPYLDKSPKVKELIEKNADSLKQGNVGELYQKVKEAVESGDTGSIESYIKSATDKVKQSAGSGGLEQYFKMIPGGDKILPKISQLQEIAQKHGEEAEKIVKEAVEEIQQVLQRKGDEAQKLADKAKKESKK